MSTGAWGVRGISLHKDWENSRGKKEKNLNGS